MTPNFWTIVCVCYINIHNILMFLYIFIQYDGLILFFFPLFFSWFWHQTLPEHRLKPVVSNHKKLLSSRRTASFQKYFWLAWWRCVFGIKFILHSTQLYNNKGQSKIILNLLMVEWHVLDENTCSWWKYISCGTFASCTQHR